MDRLLSVSVALQKLLDAFSPLGASAVPLAQAVGRVLSTQIVSDIDLPLFDNSSMDGFAVRVVDIRNASRERPVTLPVVADIPAGQVAGINLHPGQAVRIMTGATLPEGAEAVIPVEDTDFNDRKPGIAAPEEVRLYRPVKPGENVRPRGQDVHKGEIVLNAQRRLSPQDIGIMAMLGIAQAPVYQRPKVAVLSTGDELVPVDGELQPGKIHESNSYMVSALVQTAGGEALNLGIAQDRADTIKALLDQAVEQKVNLILSSAGVSVGAFDYVRSIVEENGSLTFWKVNMRPGKPLAFGHYQGIPFIGLPGNPVSAYVGFEVFVRPAILKMAGRGDWSQPVLRVNLGDAVESDGRESYLRARVENQDGRWIAYLTGHQGSGNLRSLVQANALLIIPSGVKSLPVGSEAEAWLLN